MRENPLFQFFLVLTPMFVMPVLSAAPVEAREKVVAVVRNHTRIKILDSNNVSLRPGSVYDNITIFESLLHLRQPGFNYEFIDSGLGAAEPLYPMYQKGHQQSWRQLFPAFFSRSARHIDHFSSLETPEGCAVDSLYGLRHINEYPPTMFPREREAGFEQIVVRLEHYTRLFPGAQCGRHFSEAPDPAFDPMAFLKAHRQAMTFDDFPARELERFEWKISAIHHMSEVRNKRKWPRFDPGKLEENSLWYYPRGHEVDYGIREPRPQPGLASLKFPSQLLVPATDGLQRRLPLSRLLPRDEFSQVLAFLSGKPTPDFDPATEPGGDALQLSEVTDRNIYSSGLYLERIRDARADVSDPRHYAFVGMTIKPREEQEDPHWEGGRLIPQVRFVYQLMDPRKPGRPFEQLYYHLKFDVVDRHADPRVRDLQRRHFLKRVDELTALQGRGSAYDSELERFIREFTARPLESVSFSSSLTGIWIFGTLTRSAGTDGKLHAQRIVREGVDVGYYSSTYDNDLFRDAIEASDGLRKERLESILDDLTPTVYRDPRRQDTGAIRFGRVTCAQCHQMSGRDGVHLSLNDGVDRRFTSPVRASEYFYREADRQLREGESEGPLNRWLQIGFR